MRFVWIGFTVCLGILFVLLVTLSSMSKQINYLEYQLAENERVLEETQMQFVDACSETEKLRNMLEDTNLHLINVQTAKNSCEDRLIENKAIVPPGARISFDDVFFDENRVVIMIDDIVPGIIAPSKSMSPVLAENNIVLEIIPQTPDDIYIGDIIIFEHENKRIIHRVIEIGKDEQGWFAMTRGDNNIMPDNVKVRFEQVKGITVGIIY